MASIKFEILKKNCSFTPSETEDFFGVKKAMDAYTLKFGQWLTKEQFMSSIVKEDEWSSPKYKTYHTTQQLIDMFNTLEN